MGKSIWLLVLSVFFYGVQLAPAADVDAIREKAESGDAEAQISLGIMYAYGRGVPKDEAEAVKWYRKAAEQGDDSAQHNLGAMYADGLGVPKNEAEAVKWYRKAADQGNAPARHKLRFSNKRTLVSSNPWKAFVTIVSVLSVLVVWFSFTKRCSHCKRWWALATFGQEVKTPYSGPGLKVKDYECKYCGQLTTKVESHGGE